MKKFIIWIISIVLSLSLILAGVGCRGSIMEETAAPPVVGDEEVVSEEPIEETAEEAVEDTAIQEMPGGGYLTVEQYNAAVTMTPDELEAFGAENLKGKEFTVGLYCHTNMPPWKILQNAALLRAQELSEKYDFTLNIDIQAPPTHVDIIRQSNIIDDFIAKGVDMIVAIPVTTGSYEALVKRIGDAGIPMGAFITDQDPPEGYEDTLKWWLYNDDVNGGKAIAEYVAPLYPENAKATIMRGVYECHWDQGRYAGIIAGLREFPNIEILDVTAGEWDRDKGFTRAEEWIARYGDELDGIWLLNDEMAWGAQGAAEAAGIELILNGWDGATDFVEAVGEGRFPATVDMHWMGYGIQMVDLMFETLKGNEVNTKRNLLRLTLITQDNAQALLDEVDTVENQFDKPSTWNDYKLFNYRIMYGTELDTGVEYKVE